MNILKEVQFGKGSSNQGSGKTSDSGRGGKYGGGNSNDSRGSGKNSGGPEEDSFS